MNSNKNIFSLDKKYSTTSYLTKEIPVFDCDKKSVFKRTLFSSEDFLVDGGLRRKGYYKSNTKDNILVSIITIVKNGQDLLEDTIKSILCQSYKNVEYIIVDGCSNDNTLKIIKEYDDKIDYWISQNDSGISDALNTAIKLTTGEIIGIIHAGDLLLDDAISNLFNYYSGSNKLYCGKVKIVGRKLPVIRKPEPHLLNKKCSIGHIGVFVPISIYRKFGVYSLDYKIAMDYDFFYRLYKDDVEFKLIDEIFSVFILGGISDRSVNKGFYECHLIRLKYGEFYILSYFKYLFLIVYNKLIRIFIN